MGFVNAFTDNPSGTISEMPETAQLFSVTVNPVVKDRTEYVVTYWIDVDDSSTDVSNHPEEPALD